MSIVVIDETTTDEPIANLAERLAAAEEADEEVELIDLFLDWTMDIGIELYPAQEEAILEIFDDKHVILNTPTGSGKSMVALAMHFFSFANEERSFYTSPIKALVSEKFFALCDQFGAENVGMLTGDVSINPGGRIICCTQEILAATALSEGEDADIQHAIIDEFHYYADRERGTAWQLPLLMMPQTVFLLMSATLGDTTHIADQLEERSEREVALVSSTQRPVPLSFDFSKEKTVHLIDRLVRENKAPVYAVCFTQRDCSELAQSLMSVNYCTDQDKAAIKDALRGKRFDTPYGSTVRRYLLHGIAIHHGGMLPKYRFIAESLSQQGLLKLVVGTDTLGVGINMPLRTVVFTKLCKYDGQKTRLLTIRDFKQIAGRAGRRGFDTQGYVIAQAPEHIIENAAALQKAQGNAKKLKKLRMKPAPDKRYAHWDEAVFERMHTSDSEVLKSRFSIDHSTLLYLLQRPKGAQHGYEDLLELIELSHESDVRKVQLREYAAVILESLEQAGLIEVEEDEEGSRTVTLSESLQDDFSIHHSLSLFLVDVIQNLNPEHPTFAMTVLSFVEAILEQPMVILRRQQSIMRDREYQRLKAEDTEYNELREKLDEVTWPKPEEEVINQAFKRFSDANPWVSSFEPKPKSVAREMYERWTTFNQYIKEYGLERSEGALLRHLNQTYKALRQNIPEDAKNEQIHDMIAYLQQILTQADSSLLAEWERLRQVGSGEEQEQEPQPLDADPVAFKARVRAEMMLLVSALSEQRYEEAVRLLRPTDEPWRASELEDAFAPFYEEYKHIVFGHEARSKDLIKLKREGPGFWQVTQVLVDPERDNMWHIRGEIDLQAIESEHKPLIALIHVGN